MIKLKDKVHERAIKGINELKQKAPQTKGCGA